MRGGPMTSETAPRKPLAPVVREHGQWTYQAELPTDFFTREALMHDKIQQWLKPAMRT